MTFLRSLPQNVLELFRRRNGNREALLGLLGRLTLAGEVVRLLRHREAILRVMTHPLDGARARIAAGSEQLNALETQISEILATLRESEVPPVGIDGDLDADGKHWNVKITYVVVPPVSLGIAVAQIVHHFRTALDYLAFELSFVDSGGIEHKGNASFPLVTRGSDSWRTCGRKFEGDAPNRLPGVTLRHRAAIKRRQPYHRWDGPWGHPLTMLAYLDNDNKHRLVQPAYFTPWEWSLGPGFVEQDCEILAARPAWVWDLTRRPLEPGAELARIPIRVTGPDPRVEVEAEVRTAIAFRNGLPVEDVLKEIRTLVTEIIDEFVPVFDTPKARRVWRPRPGRIETLPKPIKGRWTHYRP